MVVVERQRDEAAADGDDAELTDRGRRPEHHPDHEEDLLAPERGIGEDGLAGSPEAAPARRERFQPRLRPEQLAREPRLRGRQLPYRPAKPDQDRNRRGRDREQQRRQPAGEQQTERHRREGERGQEVEERAIGSPVNEGLERVQGDSLLW